MKLREFIHYLCRPKPTVERDAVTEEKKVIVQQRKEEVQQASLQFRAAVACAFTADQLLGEVATIISGGELRSNGSEKRVHD